MSTILVDRSFVLQVIELGKFVGTALLDVLSIIIISINNVVTMQHVFVWHLNRAAQTIDCITTNFNI